MVDKNKIFFVGLNIFGACHHLYLVLGARVELPQLGLLLRGLDVDRLLGVVPGVDHEVLLLLARHVRAPGDVQTTLDGLHILDDGLGGS